MNLAFKIVIFLFFGKLLANQGIQKRVDILNTKRQDLTKSLNFEILQDCLSYYKKIKPAIYYEKCQKTPIHSLFVTFNDQIIGAGEELFSIDHKQRKFKYEFRENKVCKIYSNYAQSLFFVVLPEGWIALLQHNMGQWELLKWFSVQSKITSISECSSEYEELYFVTTDSNIVIRLNCRDSRLLNLNYISVPTNCEVCSIVKAGEHFLYCLNTCNQIFQSEFDSSNKLRKHFYRIESDPVVSISVGNDRLFLVNQYQLEIRDFAFNFVKRIKILGLHEVLPLNNNFFLTVSDSQKIIEWHLSNDTPICEYVSNEKITSWTIIDNKFIVVGDAKGYVSVWLRGYSEKLFFSRVSNVAITSLDCFWDGRIVVATQAGSVIVLEETEPLSFSIEQCCEIIWLHKVFINKFLRSLPMSRSLQGISSSYPLQKNQTKSSQLIQSRLRTLKRNIL